MTASIRWRSYYGRVFAKAVLAHSAGHPPLSKREAAYMEMAKFPEGGYPVPVAMDPTFVKPIVGMSNPYRAVMRLKS